MLPRSVRYCLVTIVFGYLVDSAIPRANCQTNQQLGIRKLAEVGGKDLKEIVLYRELLEQGLHPKMLIKQRAIEFFSPEGTIKNRVDFEHEIYPVLSSNEKYVVVSEVKNVPQDKNAPPGSGQFMLFDEVGYMLWQEFFSVDWDAPSSILRVSSKGVLCKTSTAFGTVTFYDQNGSKSAEHVLWPSFSRTGFEGLWSEDGSFYAVMSPYQRERIGNELQYSDRITLFDPTGNRSWEQILQNKAGRNLFFSSQLKWLIVSHEDMTSRNCGETILSILNGEAITEIPLDAFGVTRAIFVQDDSKFLAKIGGRKNPQLVLYEALTGKTNFEIGPVPPIYDMKLAADKDHVYVLTAERSIPQRRDPPPRRAEKETTQKPEARRPPAREPAVPNRLELTHIQIMVLRLDGTVVGSSELPDIEASHPSLAIYTASASRRLVIRAGSKLHLYELSNL